MSKKDLITDSFRHCDDYIEDPKSPPALRAFLERARRPAHGMLAKGPMPKLFADFQGARWRVTMASRLGDVGITQKLDNEFGYSKRVAIEDLANLSDTP